MHEHCNENDHNSSPFFKSKFTCSFRFCNARIKCNAGIKKLKLDELGTKKKKISNKKNTKTISSELDFTDILNANHMNTEITREREMENGKRRERARERETAKKAKEKMNKTQKKIAI